jgi:hypothetical protein
MTNKRAVIMADVYRDWNRNVRALVIQGVRRLELLRTRS